MTVIVYADFNCSYSYLASQRADLVNRAGVGADQILRPGIEGFATWPSSPAPPAWGRFRPHAPEPSRARGDCPGGLTGPPTREMP